MICKILKDLECKMSQENHYISTTINKIYTDRKLENLRDVATDMKNIYAIIYRIIDEGSIFHTHRKILINAREKWTKILMDCATTIWFEFHQTPSHTPCQ